MVTYVAGLTCSKAGHVPRLTDRKLPLAEQLELKKPNPVTIPGSPSDFCAQIKGRSKVF